MRPSPLAHLSRFLVYAGAVMAFSACTIGPRSTPSDRDWVESLALEEAAGTPSMRAGGWRHGVVAHIGGRGLDEDIWSPLEDQGVLGVEYDGAPVDSLIGLEAGIVGSVATEDVAVTGPAIVELRGAVFETYVGARLSPPGRDPGLKPYVGAGVSLVSAAIEAESGSTVVDDDDSSLGGYVHGGLYYLAGSGLRVGLDVRGVFGTDMTLFGASGDADYAQVTVLIGGSF